MINKIELKDENNDEILIDMLIDSYSLLYFFILFIHRCDTILWAKDVTFYLCKHQGAGVLPSSSDGGTSYQRHRRRQTSRQKCHAQNILCFTR